jgi:hypothetical protein
LATPVEQTVEHEPQLFGSLVVSAQPLVQSVGVVLGQFEASGLELPDELPDDAPLPYPPDPDPVLAPPPELLPEPEPRQISKKQLPPLELLPPLAPELLPEPEPLPAHPSSSPPSAASSTAASSSSPSVDVPLASVSDVSSGGPAASSART